jgi:hypothetical protein
MKLNHEVHEEHEELFYISFVFFVYFVVQIWIIKTMKKSPLSVMKSS